MAYYRQIRLCEAEISLLEPGGHHGDGRQGDLIMAEGEVSTPLSAAKLCGGEILRDNDRGRQRSDDSAVNFFMTFYFCIKLFL